MWLGDIPNNRRVLVQVCKENKGSAVEAFPELPLGVRIVESGVRTAYSFTRLAIATLEDQSLPRVVVRQVIPLKPGTVEDLEVLRDKIVKDHITGDDVRCTHGACVAQTEWPIVQRAPDGFPYTKVGHVVSWPIECTRHGGVSYLTACQRP